MTTIQLSEKEIYEKGEALNIGQNIFEYRERELETKMCKDCGHLFDPGNCDYPSDVEDMSFCNKCGGELEENTNLDGLACVVCQTALLEDEEGYVSDERKIAVCNVCYEDIPVEYIAPEEIKKQEEARANRKPLRMIAPNELVGKTIARAYHVEWNGTFVVHTTDNCICATYSQYDMFSGKTTHEYIEDLADYHRLCK